MTQIQLWADFGTNDPKIADMLKDLSRLQKTDKIASLEAEAVLFGYMAKLSIQQAERLRVYDDRSRAYRERVIAKRSKDE